MMSKSKISIIEERNTMNLAVVHILTKWNVVNFSYFNLTYFIFSGKRMVMPKLSDAESS